MKYEDVSSKGWVHVQTPGYLFSIQGMETVFLDKRMGIEDTQKNESVE